MTGDVVIKGFLDPRIGDELIIGRIEKNDNPSLSIFTMHQMTKGFSKREEFIRWDDGTIERGIRTSGAEPPYPTPKRNAIKAIVQIEE